MATENDTTKLSPFVGFNLRKSIFQDKRVRQALSELMNRPLIIEKFFYNRSLVATGPWYQQNPYADKKAKPFAYNPENAKKLLKEAGWADTDKDGVLDKVIDGKKVSFQFQVIYANDIWERYLTVFKEDLKKAGVTLDLKLIEWNAFQKLIDENKFDTVALSWSGSIEYDPKQIWHSENIRKGSSNFAAYSNPKVDKLIDEAREELNAEKRKKLLAKVYSTIAADYPYIFLWNAKNDFYAYSSRIGMAKPYYRYDTGVGTWWVK